MSCLLKMGASPSLEANCMASNASNLQTETEHTSMLQKLTQNLRDYHLTVTFQSEIHHRLIFYKNKLLCYIMKNTIRGTINDINGTTPKSSISKRFSVANHPFGSRLIYGNPHVDEKKMLFLCHHWSAIYHDKLKCHPFNAGYLGAPTSPHPCCCEGAQRGSCEAALRLPSSGIEDMDR